MEFFKELNKTTKISKSKVKKVFAEIDTNGDGELSFNECKFFIFIFIFFYIKLIKQKYIIIIFYILIKNYLILIIKQSFY